MTELSNITLPFEPLNLKVNPFGALTPAESARLAVVDLDLEDLAGRLSKPGFAVQFLGPSGRGKSTHLFAIRGHFPDQPYTYVPEDGPVPEIPDTAVQFIDEMQRIPHSSRRAILKRPASFVIGSHKNHRREFEKAGLEHKVIRLRGITCEQLLAILNRRIEWARRSPDLPVPHFTNKAAANLIAAHGDDLWAIEDYLYDVFQELSQAGEVKIGPPNAAMKLKKHLKASLALFEGRAPVLPRY